MNVSEKYVEKRLLKMFLIFHSTGWSVLISVDTYDDCCTTRFRSGASIIIIIIIIFFFTLGSKDPEG